MLKTDRKKLAVLISGRGSNMEEILQATRDPAFPAQISVVISDNKNAAGLETARSAGIAAKAFERTDHASRDEHERAVIDAIQSADADLVILAGYMRILSKQFVEAFEGRLVNIHPSLLPAYKGLDTHQRAIDDKAKRHGCTVHFVNAEMDGGKIIAQECLDILPGDTADTLAARVLKLEHALYPVIVGLLAGGDIRLVNDELVLSDAVTRKPDGTIDARANS